MRPRSSSRTIALLATAALAALAPALGAAPAMAAVPGTGPGVFSGSIGVTIPKGATVDVRAVNRATGVVAGTTSGSKSGGFSLSLPAGAYQVVGTVITPGKGKTKGSVQTVSAGLTLAAGQQRKKADVKAAKKSKKKSSKKKATKKAVRSYAQELGQVTPGSVAVAIPDFSSGGSDPGVKGWNEIMMVDAMNASAGCPGATPGTDVTYVETDRRADLEAELAFQQSKYVDPSTAVQRNFVIPDVTVVGTVSGTGADRTLTIDVRDANGQSLGSSTSTIHEDTAFDDLEAAGTKLGQDLCKLSNAYEVDLDVSGTGNLSTHTGTGQIHAKLVARRNGAAGWAGSGMYQWTVDSYASLLKNADALNPVSTACPWHASLALQPDGSLILSWGIDGADLATLTLDVRPDPGSSYDPPPIPGLMVLTLMNAVPTQGTVSAAGGALPITSSILSSGSGVSTSGTVTVKRLGVVKDG